MPYHSLQGELAVLKKLDNRPLGGFLFKHQDLQRGRFELCRINQSQASQILPMSVEQEIYARRSIFSLQQKKLLVAEYFLPDCPIYY